MAAARGRAAAVAVGLLPRSSVSGHSRGDHSILSQMTARVCGGGGGEGGGSLPFLWSPRWAERGKGPLEAHDPKA